MMKMREETGGFVNLKASLQSEYQIQSQSQHLHKPTTENDHTLWPNHWTFQNRPKRDRRKLPVRFGQAPNEIFTYEPEEDNQE